jgi:hypothetical protein
VTNPAIDDFIGRAQDVSVTEAAGRLGIAIKPGDKGQPCPICGGRDRFSINAAKQKWNCRGCARGGSTGIGLVGFVRELDLHVRAQFLEACSTALGEELPEGGERETEEERDERARRNAEARRKREEKRAERERQQQAHRQRENDKARGIYRNALTAPHAEDGVLREYLRLRTGYVMAEAVYVDLRFHPKLTYWHGLDDLDRPVSIYSGYAMVAPFVDLSERLIGSHLTWIDLSRSPKFRPDLGLDEDGDPLPTKKMRGSKAGGFIPVCGDIAARRWVGGEGIETVAAVAGYEGFDRRTFYFASGDLGNLAGPAEPSSFFRHPTLAKTDKLGRVRAVRVPGPVPRAGQGPGDALQIPAHVTSLVLLADGDSEFYFTAAAMARAKARFSQAGRAIDVWWPPKGMDFASLLSGRD